MPWGLGVCGSLFPNLHLFMIGVLLGWGLHPWWYGWWVWRWLLSGHRITDEYCCKGCCRPCRSAKC